MAEFITVSVDSEASADTMVSVLADLRKVEAVTSVRTLEPRALDPQSIKALVEVASGVLGMFGSAWTLIDKIRKALHTHKVLGAHLTLSNGVRIDIDKIEEEQLRRLLEEKNDETAGEYRVPST